MSSTTPPTHTRTRRRRRRQHQQPGTITRRGTAAALSTTIAFAIISQGHALARPSTTPTPSAFILSSSSARSSGRYHSPAAARKQQQQHQQQQQSPQPSSQSPSSSLPLHSIAPGKDDDYPHSQHERLTFTPSWRQQREPSALENALWGLPSFAANAHAGLVNLTGSVVSGLKAVVTPAPPALAATVAGGAGGAATAKDKASTAAPFSSGNAAFGEDDDDSFFDRDDDDSFFTPLHAYDDSLELVVWDDATLYTPPVGSAQESGEPWEEDSPVMSQLQEEVAQMLGRAPPPPSRMPQAPPPLRDDEEDGEEKKNKKNKKEKEKAIDPHVHAAEVQSIVAPEAAAAAAAALELESTGKENGSGGNAVATRRRSSITQSQRVKHKLVGVAFFLAHTLGSTAAEVVRGPQRRARQVSRFLGMVLRAVIAFTVFFGTTFSTLVRRVISPQAKSLPRPDLAQRLTTTFTRFLHENYPWLLAHPIFYGRPFFWQWKGWKPQPPPPLSLGPTIPGLPSLSALLRDLGDAVTPHSVVKEKQQARQQQEKEQQQRPTTRREWAQTVSNSDNNEGGTSGGSPPWTLPLHPLKDDWSKSILQLDANDARMDHVLMTAPPPPSAVLDLVSVDFTEALSSFVAPSELKGKEEKLLEKEVKRVQQQQQQQQQEAAAAAAVTAAAAAPSSAPRSSSSSSSSTGTGVGTAAGSATAAAVATAANKPKKYKGPDLFTSFFPKELEEEEGPSSSSGAAASPSSAPTSQQQQQQSSPPPSSTPTTPSKPTPTIPSFATTASEKIASVFSSTLSSSSTTATTTTPTNIAAMPSPDLESLKEITKKETEADEAREAQDSAYGRILADLTTEEPMTVKEDVADAPPGLDFEMPWAASVPSLEQMDKRMIMLAVEGARTVQSKTQLWRYIEEIGVSPLLAAIKKNFLTVSGDGDDSSSSSSSSPASSSSSFSSSSTTSSIGGTFSFPSSPFGAFPSSAQSTTLDEAVESGALRTEAVEAILHLMNIAMDLRVLRAAVEDQQGLVPVIGRDVVSDLIDVVEQPLLLLMPKIIRRRNDQILYRGQRAAVEVLFQLVLASDKAIQFIQEDGRLWNALQQMTAEGMYAPESPTYATCHKLLAAIGHNEWRPKQPGQRGLRILSFDGGGTRGVLSVALLKQVMERVGKDVFETFDIICGTSTGGILAVLFGIEHSTIADAEQLYDKLVSKIFAKTPLTQTAKLLLRQAYYDEVVWEQVLQEMLGDNLMIDSMGEGPMSPKVFVASLCLKTNPASLFLWRNYAYGPDQEAKHSGSFRIMVRDALRATTAAPTFFSPLEKDDAKYCDGAFLANNPTAVALNEVRTLYPGVPVECVVSIGTGVHADQRKADGSYGWEGIVNDLINCATNTEVTHETLSVFLPKSKYYRFNPRTEFFPLDETKPERLNRMKRIAREYFWQSENKERLNQLVDLLKKGTNPLPLFRSSARDKI